MKQGSWNRYNVSEPDGPHIQTSISTYQYIDIDSEINLTIHYPNKQCRKKSWLGRLKIPFIMIRPDLREGNRVREGMKSTNRFLEKLTEVLGLNCNYVLEDVGLDEFKVMVEIASLL